MVEQSYAQLEQQLGRHATDEELSKELGVGLDEFYKILDNLKGVSLGKFVELNNNDSQANGEGDSVIAFIPDRSTDDPYHKFQKHELTEILSEAIRKLPDKERYVVSTPLSGRLAFGWKRIFRILVGEQSGVMA